MAKEVLSVRKVLLHAAEGTIDALWAQQWREAEPIREYHHLLPTLLHALRWLEEVTPAAIKVQALIRGFRARSLRQQMKEKDNRRRARIELHELHSNEATKIQRWWRRLSSQHAAVTDEIGADYC